MAGSIKYRFGLLLIGAVVLIWVASAEVTQLIFEKYRHPFLLTWLGASLLVIYLPVFYIKEWAAPFIQKFAPHGLQAFSRIQREKSHGSSGSLTSTNPGVKSPKEAEMTGPKKPVEVELSSGSITRDRGTRKDGLVPIRTLKDSEIGSASQTLRRDKIMSPRSDVESDNEEERPLIAGQVAEEKAFESETLSSIEVIKCALMLAPLWLLTEYLSNAALSMTSVASTTILSSTSGLFTLLFGVSIGGDNLTTGKVLAALVSIAGVVMTELGKSSAADDSQVFGAGANPGETAGDLTLPGQHLAGDICGLLSAVSYGCYTTLLKKSVGGEEGGEEKADLQKVFGFIGLFTLLGLWWLVFPLHVFGWEPIPRMPSSYGLDEDILANGLIGSVISDYFWALSVVWTTPLVATLGLSLTIPLAMVADMVMHGRLYSPVYIFGAFGVFAGFIVANMGDDFSPSAYFSFFSTSWSAFFLKKPMAPPRSPGVDVAGAPVLSDKEND